MNGDSPDALPAAIVEVAGGERGGCKTTLKPRESPGGEIEKSLLRSPGQSCFSLPNAVMTVCKNSLCMGTWEEVWSGPWWEQGREIEVEGCLERLWAQRNPTKHCGGDGRTKHWKLKRL